MDKSFSGFSGFSAEAFVFFMMIRLNNNKAFFDENQKRYEELLKDPLYALAGDMADFISGIDPRIDTRPHRAVARIRRSTRYTKDKSPYRDHLWISWRDRSRDADGLGAFTFYFSMEFEGMSCGSGFYGANPRQMAELRARIAAQPERFERAARSALDAGLTLYGEDYKKLAIPENLPELCRAFYVKKSFYLDKELPVDGENLSEKLLDKLKHVYSHTKDLYDFVNYG